MKPTTKYPLRSHRTAVQWLRSVLIALPLTAPAVAHASMFHGETLDKVADVMTWVVLVIAPVVAIGVFLLIHILPEKIAEKKQHPQLNAIKTLCLLSLFFGGMLWPLAWLWAYTKPVIHKLAYGTDKEPHGAHEAGAALAVTPENTNEKKVATDDVAQLRQRIAELEAKLAGTTVAAGGKG